jgi:hypothetical protein
MTDTAAPFVCLVERPEASAALQQFFKNFQLEATWVKAEQQLVSLLEDPEQGAACQCVFLDEAFPSDTLFKVLKMVRYFPHTKDTHVLLLMREGTEVYPYYQVGASLCLDFPLNQKLLESAFDHLFGEDEE